MSAAPPYRDLWFRLAGSLLWAHFVRSLGGPSRLLADLATPDYYIEVLAGAALTFGLWTLIRAVSRRLDLRFDWLAHPLSRLSWQLALGVALPALLTFFGMMLFFRFLLQFDIFQTPWLHNEYPVSVLFLVAINGYYAGYFFFLRAAAADLAEKTTARPLTPAFAPGTEAAAAGMLRSLIVTKGARSIPVPVDEAAYFFIRDENIFLKTFDDQAFLADQTLDELAARLPSASFFRANRQTLVHFRACASYRNIENGKLALDLQPAHIEPVIVSQKKAREFREWLASH